MFKRFLWKNYYKIIPDRLLKEKKMTRYKNRQYDELKHIKHYIKIYKNLYLMHRVFTPSISESNSCLTFFRL